MSLIDPLQNNSGYQATHQVASSINEVRWISRWAYPGVIALLLVIIVTQLILMGNQNQLYRSNSDSSYRAKYEQELAINAEVTRKYLDLLIQRGCGVDGVALKETLKSITPKQQTSSEPKGK